MAAVVQVVRVRVDRRPLAVPELTELFGLAALPLAPSYVEIELKGVPTAYVNALRRAVTDEMPGRALAVPPGGFDTEATTETFMLPQFVNGRISCLRLRPQIPAETVANLRLALDVSNDTASVKSVYAGDLTGGGPEPLFNPTTVLAELQPGKRIVIRGIYISTGYGRDNGVYNVACRAAYTHLDLPTHDDAEVRGRRDADAAWSGSAADWSGYKVSSLVADPRHHLLTAVIPATTANAAEVRAVFADACANVVERLRLIATAVDRGEGGGAHRGVQYTVVALEGGLTEGILDVPGETHTIGELLKRATFETAPDIASIAYRIVSHENRLNFTLRHAGGDVTQILKRAIKEAIEIFNAIARGIAGK